MILGEVKTECVYCTGEFGPDELDWTGFCPGCAAGPIRVKTLLKRWRKQHGWNQRRGAKEMRIPYSTYISWEQGIRYPGKQARIVMEWYFMRSFHRKQKMLARKARQ